MNERNSLSGHLSTETLAEYAEGLLGAPEAAQAEVHLGDCADCRAEEQLLASLTDILAADDPGPMPAHYAARIDVALAEVAMETGRTPVGAPFPADAAATAGAASAAGGTDGTADVTPGEGAQVVDLASRRRVVASGFRRVSTVAASVVLLIGGAALGLEALRTDGAIVQQPIAAPEVTSLPKSLQKSLEPPKNAKKGPGKNSRVDPKTGIIYKDDGEVLLTDGRRVIPGKNGGPPTIVLPPDTKIKESKQQDRGSDDSKGDEGRSTVDRPGQSGTEGDPGKQPQTFEQPPPVAQPTPVQSSPVKTPATPGGAPSEAQAMSARAKQGPYVTVTNNTYDQSNFASRVRELLILADEYYSESSTGSPQPDDASESPPPPVVQNDAPTVVPQNLGVSFSRQPTQYRGDAPEAVARQVDRCAGQLGATAVAGDSGFWQPSTSAEPEPATIVVVENPQDQNQVVGYVFVGEDACTKANPASADSAAWWQAVDKPGSPAASREAGRSVQP